VINKLRERRSIVTQLMRKVFVLYCVVALGVTLVHIVKEYQYTQGAIETELRSYEGIFGSLLGRALWDLDGDQINDLLHGLYEVPVIVGVKIERTKGDGYELTGETGRTSTNISKVGNNNPDKPFRATFHYQFPIKYQFLGEDKVLGRATLFSDSTVVLDRVKLGFVFLMVNALIKGVALWFIFLWISERLLVRPLNKLIDGISDVNFDTLSEFDLNLELEHQNELATIEDSFSSMVHELGHAQRKVLDFNHKLEEEVESRTVELVKARDAAEAGDKAKSEFLAVMSHELRTPINGILGMLSILARTELNERQTKCSTVALESTKTLMALVTDILDYSQIEAGGVELELTDFDLRYHVCESMRGYGRRAEKKGLSLVLDISGVPEGVVRGDISRVHKIFDILLDNALKFTAKGSVILKLELALSNDIIVLRGSVIDTGIGMAKEHVAHLFEAFSQGDSSSSRSYEGTGLGLAMAKKLCSLMSGSIVATSVEGEGSAFRFEIELLKGDRAPLLLDKKSLGGVRVLLADNSVACRVNLRGQLEIEGAAVVEVSALELVMECVDSHNLREGTSVVIINGCDYGAKEVIDALRRKKEYDNIKIVVMTSIRMEEAGNVEFSYVENAICIAKPITPISLQSLV